MKVYQSILTNLSIALLLAMPLFSFESHAAQRYQSELIQAQPAQYHISRTGKVSFKRTVNLSFKVNGYLSDLNVDEGDVFSHNKVLAALETVELKEDKNTAYARLVLAKKEVERVQAMMSKNLSSQKELDVAETDVETTRSAYQVAYYNLEKSQLIAPFNGIVVQRYSDLGELQSPGQPALEVAALENNLVVKVALTSEEVSLVKLKQEVSISLGQLTRVTGYISKMPAMADKNSHLFVVEVLIPQMPNSSTVISGQLAKIDVRVRRSGYVYKLPVAALNSIAVNGEAIVVVMENDKHRKRTFKIDGISNDFVYLSADNNSPALRVVTQGWQHIMFKDNQDAKATN